MIVEQASSLSAIQFSSLLAAILGLTIIAIGNSVGDWVADTAVARAGHPAMVSQGKVGGWGEVLGKREVCLFVGCESVL